MNAPLVIALDPSWASCGVCFASEGQPIEVHAVPLTAKRRWLALPGFLESVRQRAEGLRKPGQRVAVVIEELPKVYSGRGNQAAVAGGLGSLIGAIMAWAAGLHLQSAEAARVAGGELVWLPPVEIGEARWRGWYRIRTYATRLYGHARRDALKKAACWMVEQKGWAGKLDGIAQKRRSDAAEALLLGCGASRRPEVLGEAPKRYPKTALPG